MLHLRSIIIYQLYLVLNMKQIAGFRYKSLYSSIMSHIVIHFCLYIHILTHGLPVISAPVEVETMQQITKSDATIFIKVDCWIEDVYIDGIGVFYLFRQNIYQISMYFYLKCILGALRVNDNCIYVNHVFSKYYLVGWVFSRQLDVGVNLVMEKIVWTYILK